MLDSHFMGLALRLARRGYGATSPNPMVGAILVKGKKIIGQGWHRQAGLPHAEIEALHDAKKRRHSTRGAILYVTLEPCSTHGRTPPCTEAILAAGIGRVVIGATDPNPKHRGKAYASLRQADIEVTQGILADEAERLNEAFNHWIVEGTPLVTVKAAMTLDGKIATASGESKWITGEKARAYGMKLREGSDAIVAGVNTIIADDPSLTFRNRHGELGTKRLRRIVLDPSARTPLSAKVVSDENASLTTIVVLENAPKARVSTLARKVHVVVSPSTRMSKNQKSPIDLRWLIRKLGSENVTALLVEGGGETNATFLLGGFAHRVAFFYAPKIVCGRDARKAVGGDGVVSLKSAVRLSEVQWRRLGEDLLLTARVRSLANPA